MIRMRSLFGGGGGASFLRMRTSGRVIRVVIGTEVQVIVGLQSHCCTTGAGDVVGSWVDDPQRVCTDSVKA